MSIQGFGSALGESEVSIDEATVYGLVPPKDACLFICEFFGVLLRNEFWLEYTYCIEFLSVCYLETGGDLMKFLFVYIDSNLRRSFGVYLNLYASFVILAFLPFSGLSLMFSSFKFVLMPLKIAWAPEVTRPLPIKLIFSRLENLIYWPNASAYSLPIGLKCISISLLLPLWAAIMFFGIIEYLAASLIYAI